MPSQSHSNFSSSFRSPSGLLALLCFVLCVFSTAQYLQQPLSLSSDVRASDVQDALHLEHNGQVKLAEAAASSTAASTTVLTQIEDLRVGMRVRADSPTDELDTQFGSRVIASQWRKLTLTSPKIQRQRFCNHTAETA